MNRIYRLVFNAALGQVQVAAELANAPQRAAVRVARSGRVLPSLLAAAVLSAMAPQVQAADLPTGFAAVGGSATLSPGTNSITVTQTGKVSLVNWSTFDIAQGNTVNFNMPSASSGSINIVNASTGGISQIAGTISSTGNVILINTNGILFNQGSKVDVGGLVASTLTFNNNVDLSGTAELPLIWNFSGGGTSSPIINQGELIARTGGISVIGGTITNLGSINAASNASLIVGSAVESMLMQPGIPTGSQPGSWSHLVQGNATSSGASAITHLGSILGGGVEMKARVQDGMFINGVNSVGTVQAHSIRNGSLVVDTNAAANIYFGSGANATTLGSVSVSATGRNAAVNTWGTLTADSVVLNSNGALQLGSTINAGRISLYGGSIRQSYETSPGEVNIGALKGDVEVTTTGEAVLNASRNAISSIGGSVGTNLALASTTNVGQDQALQVGGTTTLDGLAGSSGARAGFKLDHAGNVFGNTISGASGDVALTSGSPLRLGQLDVDSLAATGSAIRLSGNVRSSTGQSYGGPVTLGSDVQLSSSQGGSIIFDSTVDGAYALSVTTLGNTTFNGAVGANTALASLASLGGGSTRLFGNVTAADAITLGGNLFLAGDVVLTSTTDKAIRINGTVNSEGGARALTVDTDGLAVLGRSVGGSSVLSRFTRTGTGGTQLGGTLSAQDNIALQGGLSLTAVGGLNSQNGSITVGGPVTSIGAASFAAAGDIVLANAQNQFGGAVSLAGDTVKLAQQGSLQLGNVDAGDLTVDASGVISQLPTDRIRATGASSISSRSGSALYLVGAGNRFDGTLSLRGGNAALVATGTLRLGNVNVASLDVRGDTIYLPHAVDTVGLQSYSGNLWLQGDTVLSSTRGQLALNGTLQGPYALSLVAGGPGAYIGATTTIGALSASGGVTQLASNVTTQGDISLGRAEVIGNVALASTGGAVRVAGTLNGSTSDVDSLAITAAGAVDITGNTGAGIRLRDLSLTGANVSTAAVAVGHDLSISSGTSIVQAGAFDVGGDARFISTGNITLTNLGNQFSGDVALSGQNVDIAGQGDLSLSGVNVRQLSANTPGRLTLRDATSALSTTLRGGEVLLDNAALGATSDVAAANAGITQQGNVSVGGASTWAAAGNIQLNNLGNQFGGAVTASGANISLAASSALNLADVNASGQAGFSANGVHLGNVRASGLAVESGAYITQDAALVLPGAALFIASGDVVLDNAGNQFGSGVQLMGRNITIDSANQLTLNGVDATGNLSATAHAGTLQQTGFVRVNGRSDLRASGNVMLQERGNIFGGAVAVQGQNIQLSADSNLAVDSVRNGGNGAVQLKAGGDLTVGGDAIDTGTNVLSLVSTGGTATTTTALRGNQVTLGGATGVSIGGDINATMLALNATGNRIVQQSGRIVAGTATLDAGQGDIVLDNADNRFTGVTSLAGRDIQLAAGDLLLGNVQAGRDLRLDSSGSIQQQAQMRVDGNADLRASGDITLLQASNHFGGDVALHATQAAVHADQALSLAQVQVDGLQATAGSTLSLRDAVVADEATLQGASIVLARADVGRVDATATAGSITQTDGVTLGDGSTLTARDDVALDQASNHLGSGLQVQGGNVSLSTLGVLDQADVQAAGLVALSGDGVQLGTVRAGSLQVDSRGDIGQSVALVVGGDSRFAATGNIGLGHAGNQFGGGVQLSGQDVRIDSASQLRLDGVAAGGDFMAVAQGGSIRQTGSVQVQGRTDLVARDDIILLENGNTFGGAVALDASATSVKADSNLRVDGLHTRNGGTAWLAAAGDLTLAGNAINVGGGALVANAMAGQLRSATAVDGAVVILQGRDGVTVGADINAGQLVLTSDAGDVRQQAGRIHVSDAAALLGSNGDIVVDNADNRFDGSLLLIGRDIRVAAGDLQLDGVQASGDLSLASSGSIVQSNQIEVDGNARFIASGDITLQQAGNRFDGDVALQGGVVRISADPGLSLQGVVADQLDASTQGALSLSAATVSGGTLLQGGSIALSSIDVGRLDATAASGGITQGGTVTLGAGSQLSASGDIVLGNAGNQFGSGLQAQASNITLASAGLLDLATVQSTGAAVLSGNGVNLGALSTGSLQVDSGAGITQGSALSVDDDSRFTAAGDVVLDDAGNRFGGGVQLGGRNVSIASAGALRLDGVTAGGDLAARALGGDLTQGDSLSVAGRSALQASGNLVLADAGNQFGGGVTLQGQAVQLRAAGNLQVDDLRNAADGAVSLSAGGDLQVDGSAISTGTQALQLASAGQLRNNVALQGDSVQLRGSNGVVLGADVTAGRDLQLASVSGDIVQAGGRIVSDGSTGVDAGRGNVALGAAGNAFGGTLALRGADIRVAGGDLQLAGVAASGDLVLDSSGAITQAGTVDVGGDARFTAASAVDLGSTGNRFGGRVAMQAQRAVIASATALDLQADVSGDLGARSGAGLQLAGDIGGNASVLAGQVNLGRTTVGGNLQVDSSAAISQDAALAVAGTTRLSSRSAVVLDAAGNTFGGAVDVAGNGITLAASGDLQLAGLDNTAGGGIAPQAAGGAVKISASGNLLLPATRIDTGAADLSLSSGGILQTKAALAGGNVSLGGTQGVQLGHDVRATGTLALDSDGAITQSAGTLTAARLQGRAGGAATLASANQIAQLGDFSAASLDLATQGGLQVAGTVSSRGSTQLETRGGDLLIEGSVQGDNVRLLSAGGIRAGDTGRIVATTLSGRAAGATRLGEADRFVANQVQTLGDFQSQAGFSLTNARTLTLASVNGSSWSVDAGNADFFLKVDGGDLLQAGTTPVFAGTSHWWSSGRIGTQAAPIHLVSSGSQHVVDYVGRPPAYFNALNRQSQPLVLGGALNEPAAILAARAQGAVLPRVAYLDMGAVNAPQRALGVVQPGIRLPADQMPACDRSNPDAECAR